MRDPSAHGEDLFVDQARDDGFMKAPHRALLLAEQQRAALLAALETWRPTGQAKLGA